jgi:uncharacterized protein (DUF169 family)
MISLLSLRLNFEEEWVMSAMASLSGNLVSSLGLDYVPVGVTLYGKKDTLPAGVAPYGKNLKSYCQALILAGRGETMLLSREQMGCKLGTSVLGFEEEMEAFLDDGVLEKYGVGLFETEEASAETLLKSTYLEKGQTRSVMVGPLAVFEKTPQIVIFTANSEQVMWLLYALNYEKGGRMDLPQSGGALGGCADITALPLLKSIPNVTFLGLGCRIKSAIGPCELMLGMPGGMLKKVHTHIMDMAKPIAMLKNSRQNP